MAGRSTSTGRRRLGRSVGRWRGRPADGGSMSVEVAILAPAFLLLLGLAVVGGRAVIARNAVDLAAHDAARAASIARTEQQARADGEVAVEQALAQQGLACDPAASVTLTGELPGGTDVDLGYAFAPERVGELVFVVATVRCTVALADLGLPGTPGSIDVRRSFVSPMDRFRSRR
ncbi:TadE/TadG family type IV pilus assembly protein [Micromonospora zhanjiangensis]|uniref:TadE/TadG family type IV pilus assembly protein n=1 Tax=Micromonospora zhanjiangensis TaxID=1522057 RepID=A0ABV8KUT9_9ACTN